MNTAELEAGAEFPSIEVPGLGGRKPGLAQPSSAAVWKVVVAYRGRHCPPCTKYPDQLDGYSERLLDIGIDLAAVSGASRAQQEEHWLASTPGFPLPWTDGRTDADAGPVHLSPSLGAGDRSCVPRAGIVRRQRTAAATGRGPIEQPVRASRVGRPDFVSCLDTREHGPDPAYVPLGPVARFAARAGSRYGRRRPARSFATAGRMARAATAA
jgi:hypothetical protein